MLGAPTMCVGRSALLLVLALPAIASCTDNFGKTDDFESEVPLKVYTVDGWMSLEDEYIPRVCTQENGKAAREALLAQAVAARTYVLRAMRDDPTLGTEKNPII
ncbi:MAG TPA: SpoIID/LytB domain-containing protein, partial [Polyangiaceae bacterium]|nr:SpoIID/LytB domain-containing protein [Polyangiaceae bacterium]